ncbi:MAG: hypothetical protein ACRDU8_00850, partial [Egibacteraceae bacterium]
MARRPVDPSKVRPRRVWYAVAGGVGLATLAVAGVLFGTLLADSAQPVTQFTTAAPAGVGPLEPGRYTIYRHLEGSELGDPDPFARPTCQVTDAGGRQVQTSSTGGFTHTHDADRNLSAHNIPEDRAATYLLASRPTDPDD